MSTFNCIRKMEAKSPETINRALRRHQVKVDDWDFRKVAADLHTWAERMVLEFKLETEEVPALMIERLRMCLGHYRIGRNGFGINDEIGLDERHVRASPYWEVLGTLAHEILHLWQEHNGKPPGPNSRNYHNKQYREKAQEIGLIVDQYGHTQYAPGDTPFLNLLRKYGLQVPEIPQPEPIVTKGRSKLTLYQCACGVRVRVGRSRFNAKCLDCGGLFEKKE